MCRILYNYQCRNNIPLLKTNWDFHCQIKKQVYLFYAFQKRLYIWWIVFNKYIWNLNRFLNCPSLYKNNTPKWRCICNQLKMRGTNLKKRDEIYRYIMIHVVNNDIIYIIVLFCRTIITLLFIRWFFFRILCVWNITAISIVFKITTLEFKSLKIRLIWGFRCIGSFSAIWRYSEDQGIHQIYIRSADAYFERVCGTKMQFW